MRLRITTPDAVAVDVGDVAALRAEDESGSFGILPGHADFLTVLAISVVRWTEAGGAQGYCAVRGGVMTVRGGGDIAVATREALPGDDFARLESDVRTRLEAAAEEERQARLHSERLRLQAIRRIIDFLRVERRAAGAGGQ